MIEPPEEFAREHVDEKYPTSVYESDLLVRQATELFLRELEINETNVYEYKNYVAAEIDVTKAELLELLKNCKPDESIIVEDKIRLSPRVGKVFVEMAVMIPKRKNAR